MPWYLIAWGFVKKHWKVVVGILLALTLWWAFTHWLNGVKQHAFNAGELKEKGKWEEVIRKKDAENRKFERGLATDLAKLGLALSDREKDRVTKETTHTNTIREIVAKDPNAQTCKIDPRVITERNSIRDLGPNPGA
jgi:hypothetical protein